VPRTQVLQNLNLRRPQVEPSALPSIGSKLERTRRSLRNRTRTSLRPTLHSTNHDQLGLRPRRLPIRLSQTRGYTKRAGISTRNHRAHHLVRLHLLGQIINSDYVHGAFSSLSGRRKQTLTGKSAFPRQGQPSPDSSPTILAKAPRSKIAQPYTTSARSAIWLLRCRSP